MGLAALCASVRARRRIPVCLIVVAPDPSIAAWAAMPIEIGQPETVFRPLVVSAEGVPWVTTEEEAHRSPEMAVLSALSHGNEEGGVQVALAAIAASAHLDAERAKFYNDLVLSALIDAARRALEDLMASGHYVRV